MCPCYTSQQDFVIHRCWLQALLLPNKDLRGIAQTPMETGVRDLSLRLTVVLIRFYRLCSWCTEQGSNLPRVNAELLAEPGAEPRLTLITGSPFITLRACWMPRTD